jgi:tetratricopeptide (TPR) repeat protein
MARKKSNQPGKKLARGARQGDHEPSAMQLLQQLVEMVPEEARLDLLESILSGPPDDAPFPPRKRLSKSAREVERLIARARSQNSVQAALPLLEQAEQTARKALGARFAKLVGRFGDDPAGDCYLSAKLELCLALAAAGQRESALALAEEAFRLDPSDPQGVREILLAGYFNLGRNDDADRLLREECPEPWAAWLFGRLLLALRRGARGKEADQQLQLAYHHNPFVLAFLLGSRMPGADPPSAVDTGEDSEAHEYAADFLSAWKETPGAISWMREAANRLNLAIEDPEERAEPERQLTPRELADLPQHPSETWIVGMHEIAPPPATSNEKSIVKLWVIFAVSPEGEPLGFMPHEKRPTASQVWASLTEFMQDEFQPGRPKELLVHPPTLLGRLKKNAAQVGIRVAPHEHAAELAAMLNQLADRMQGGAASAQALPPGVIGEVPLDVDEVWEAAVVQLQRRLLVGGQSLRPSVALVMTRNAGMILWHELFTSAPPADALANAIRMAIIRPGIGSPRRPRQIVVRDPDEAMGLQPLSDEAGFTCLIDPELPCIAKAVVELTRHLLGGEPAVVLTKSQGIQPHDLEQFYAAAAEFFRAQPWKRFAMDEVVGLDPIQPLGERRYGLVMGQSGIMLGLAVYHRSSDMRAMFENRSEQESYDGLSVLFGEEDAVAPADLDAIEQFGWPVATPEAYPDALRIHPGRRVETPSAAEIRFLSAALLAITRLAQHKEPTTTVASPGIELKATRLGWVGKIGDGAK